jgi:phenylpropionate dioxygenase-like ring-hydroxylating dioxygenase large terminal subunit
MTMTLADPRPEVAGRPRYGLPPEAYFDPAWYAREQRDLFGRTWNYVGHVVDLPEPGSFLTAMLGNDPTVIVRTADGTLEGFVNICRHRGMTIVEGDGGGPTGTCGQSLRCPYHGWEWDLGGTLLRVPQRRTQFPDLDTSSLGLHRVAVATWGGFVFAHPDPDAASGFEAWLGGFPALCGEYPWEDLVEIERTRWDLACNWKLYIENHIDWLHLWYLHEDSLGIYDHHAGVIAQAGPHWGSAEKLRAAQERTPRDGLLTIPGLSAEERETLRANLIFPNVPFVTLGDQANTYQVIPTGPETCTLDLRVFALPGGRISDDDRASTKRILVDEDGSACERMQAAVHSPRFEVGPLALDFERPIATFHESVLRSMGDGSG